MKKKLLLIFLILTSIISYSQNSNAFKFKIEGNGYSDETIIRLLNGGSTNFDGLYDAWKLFSLNTNVPSIYTQIAPLQELSINALPEFTKDTSITIYTRIPLEGIYTIKIIELFPVTPAYKLSLTDILTNTHYQLLGDTMLSFDFQTTGDIAAFTFNLSTAPSMDTTNETCAGLNDGKLIVNNEGNTEWRITVIDQDTITVLDTISTTPINTFSNLEPGNYIAQINSMGIMDEFNFMIAPATPIQASFIADKDTVYLDENGMVNMINTSINSLHYFWDFNDGSTSSDINPAHEYLNVGTYQLKLEASNAYCSDSSIKLLTVLQSRELVTSNNELESNTIGLNYLDNGQYKITTSENNKKIIYVYSINGDLVWQDVFFKNTYSLSLRVNSSGFYIFQVIGENGNHFKKKVFLCE